MESFKYVAPLAGAMGYSAEDTAIALGIMANSGKHKCSVTKKLVAKITALIRWKSKLYYCELWDKGV